jgi:hypothetical protein
MMNSTYHVFVNGTEIQYTMLPFSDANYTFLYFTYMHSTEEIIVVPEFPSLLIIIFFTTTMLFASVLQSARASTFWSDP